MKPATVQEVIDALSKLPRDLPVYVRPKYTGTLSWTETAPVSVNGIAEMHPKSEPKNVTLLV